MCTVPGQRAGTLLKEVRVAVLPERHTVFCSPSKSPSVGSGAEGFLHRCQLLQAAMVWA